MSEGTNSGGTAPAIAPIIRLAVSLHAEGRSDDARMLLIEASALAPGRLDFREALVELLHARGDILEGVEALHSLLDAGYPRDVVPNRFGALLDRAFRHCETLYNNQEAEEAQRYLLPLTDIIPQHLSVLSMALSCSRYIGTTAISETLIPRVLALDPRDGTARMEMIEWLRRTGDLAEELRWRDDLMQAEPPAVPKINHVWNAYELINQVISDPLTDESKARIERAQAALDRVPHDEAAESGHDAWARFCRAMAGGIDLAALSRPPAPPHPAPALFAHDGSPLSVAQLRDLAARRGAKAVFLVAADEVYVQRYARPYARSVLRNAGLPVLVVIHVAGGRKRIGEIARQVGIADEGLVFTADDFDPASVTGRVLDAPTQPRITKPTGHYQSARFHQAPWILSELGLPLFVTDIDCLLERDILDLVAKGGDTDILLNENIVMRQLGARITANLLLLFPTDSARNFACFVSSYLDAVLQHRFIPKFIDQIALLMGRHYMQANHPDAKFGYFDVDTDINNCIFTEYYSHPFRFLSLYHGFDMSSLPDAIAAAEPDLQKAN